MDNPDVRRRLLFFDSGDGYVETDPQTAADAMTRVKEGQHVRVEGTAAAIVEFASWICVVTNWGAIRPRGDSTADAEVIRPPK